MALDVRQLAPEPAPAEEVFLLPASWAQERLWFLDRWAPVAALFNLPAAFRLDGPLDVAALDAAFAEIARRHETLRTGLALDGDTLQQVVEAVPRRTPLPVVDLCGLARAGHPAAEAVADAVARREAATPFALARGPLWRRALLRLAPERHRLLVTLHHTVADGWSLAVLWRELSALYRAARAGLPSPLPEPALQYADFATWQREELAGDRLAARLAPWVAALAGAPLRLDVPLAGSRPPEPSHRGARREAALPTAVAAGVDRLARAAGTTPFLVLLAAFQATLGRICEQDDLIVGTAAAARVPREVEGLIGLFANTLPLRADLAGDPSFRALLARTQETALDAFAHQDVPFEKLVDELGVERNPAYAPLIQIVFLLEDGTAGTLDLEGIVVAPLPVDLERAKYDLGVTVRLEDSGLRVAATYAADLWRATGVDRLLAAYGALLAGAVAEPESRLSALPLLPAAARHQILYEWNDTAAVAAGGSATAGDLRLHAAFERWAASTPEAPAILSAGGGRWSFAELNRRANRLAHRLRRLGVGPGALVGVRIGRTPWMAAAVLAVEKAGGVYVPLEVDWPAERVAWIVGRHDLGWLVTDEAHRPGVAAMALPALVHVVAADAADLAAERDADLPPSAGPDDLAYILFTSGSTGRPKGVIVRHRAAALLVAWVNRTFRVGPGDRLLFVTALSFDLSVYDLFGALGAGAAVRLAGDEERRDPQALAAILAGEGITFWDSAPASLLQCAGLFPEPGSPASRAARLRLVFLSGDWIPVTLPDRVRAAFPGASVVSLGGATEATVWSNFYVVGDVDPAWPSIPYGRPMSDARYHVLDRRLAPVPAGVPGDLYIAGECLSLGYAGEPRKTAASYLPDPFAAAGGPAPAGGRIYATGDRARYLPDGNLEFLGRRDGQVKLRGYRVELGEVESVLAEHPGVREAVAVVREDSPGDQRLVAYFVAAATPAPDAGQLRRHAAAKLPAYMVPAAFVTVDRWPLSATGKLDRKALPAPGEARLRAAAAAADAPHAGLEEVIARIWREVLEVERVGRDDSFFDLGGHSLLLTRLHPRLEEAAGRAVRMVDLFRHPTVASLAAFLADGALAVAVRPPSAAAAELPVARGAVAIVGMAGRFPGAANLEAYWELLVAGREGLTTFTDEELAAAGVEPARRADPRLVRRRGALADPDRFDAAFFGVPPREAEITDPQQRLLLETAWQALEDAGVDPLGHSGRIGVFAGVSATGWGDRLLADERLVEAVGRFQIKLASQHDYVATRVSYKLDLTGPSFTVQTACSTSLVAVHLACRALLAGECELALAGGASVQPREVDGYLAVPGGIDSLDGHTRPFDASASGVVAGSGVGMVVLKRLEAALADGDPIRAVVLGSAINNDGARKMGFTAPSEEGQARAIADALRAAGVGPAEIGSLRYVEAHGTGTALGDPIEVAALTRAFRDLTAETGFCALGSVKGNVGHLDAAAGVAGLIKAALALERGTIPPSLHFETPNPLIDFAGSPFAVAATAISWPDDGRPRRAGVSSFGIGGTNAHAVLAAAPAREPSGEAWPSHLLVLSARTPAALENAAGRLADRLEARSDLEGRTLADAAWTLARGRRALPYRLAVVCRDRAEGAAELRRHGRVRDAAEPPPPVVFLLPGQGAQFPGMGADLYAVSPVYRATLDRCCERLAGMLGFDLRDLLCPPPGADTGGDPAARLTATQVAQPALFAVEIALAKLWESWGVRPAAMVGHSLGELAAATIAGVFDLDDALDLVALRGRLMAAQPRGAMLATALSEEEAAAEAALDPRLSLAAVNGREATVLSGDREAVAALAGRLAARGVAARDLHTSHAFHSPAMAPAVAPFRDALAGKILRPPAIPFASNLTGAWIRDEEAVDPDYWARHLRQTVRFADGLDQALRDPWPAQGGSGRATTPALVELGPGRTLTTLARQHPSRRALAIRPSLGHARDRSGDLAHLLKAIGGLWSVGVAIDWPAVYAGQRRHRIALPTYPFERQRHAPGEREADPQRPAAHLRAGGAPWTPTERAVAGIWEEMLGVTKVDRRDDFFELGGSSLLGLRLGALLKQRLDVELPTTFLIETPTLAELAAQVDERRAGGGAAAPAASCRVRLQPGGASRRPLFLVHQVGGNVYTFRALARELGAGQPVYGLRSRGLEAGEEPLATIEEMAAHYLEAVRETQPAGPYLLGGASMGGSVAFEMARQLAAAGEEVPLLALLDAPCLEQMPRREDNAEPAYVVLRDLTGHRVDPEALRRLPREERFAAALADVESAGKAQGLDVAEALRLTRVLEANVDALYRYRPQLYAGSILFFRAATRRATDPPRPELPWIELAAGGVETVVVPGDHETMHEPPHVTAPAARLRLALDLLHRPGVLELLQGRGYSSQRSRS